MKTFRIVIWLAIVLLVSLFAYNYFSGGKAQQSFALGGPFQLVKNDGTAITDKNLLGRPHAMFFGFTNCPEICPTTLFEFTSWLGELGEEGDKLDVYFFSVDPERDTPEVLSEYMSAFDPRIRGVTGALDKMAEAIKAYRIYARKVPLDDGDYTMDHTATIFLMNADGSFAGTIAYGEKTETAMEKLRKLIKAN